MASGSAGDTSMTSMVPSSFSRTIATAVIMALMSIRMSVMTPGTKVYALVRRGLYSMRVSMPMGKGRLAGACSGC